MWNNWSGKRRFWILKMLECSSGIVALIVAVPMFFIPLPEWWMRIGLALLVGLPVMFLVMRFAEWLSPNCPHCGAKLSVMTRYYPYSACPHCGGKFDEPM